MKIKIGDKYFKVYLMTREKFNETFENGDEDEASTDVVNNTIIFANDMKDVINTCRHELFHAYYSLNLVNSSNLTMDQTEELCAEIVGKYGEELVKLSKKLHTWIKKKQKV